MAKVVIVYESKYGNTRLVAEAIGDAIKEVSGVEAIVAELKEADLNQVIESDAILVGSPNHVGRATRGIRKFISKLANVNIKGKLAVVFDTYVGGDFEKAVKKMEKQISKEIPDLKLMAPGLSVRVEGMKGPVAEGEFPKCKEFGSKIAAQMKGAT